MTLVQYYSGVGALFSSFMIIVVALYFYDRFGGGGTA